MHKTKQQLRAEFEEGRASVGPFRREEIAANLAEWIYTAPFRLEYDVTVAAYVPIRTEPGSPAILDALLDRGVTVLLPVVPPGAPTTLDWVRYDGASSLTTARFGLLEPAGDRLGPAAIEAASAIFVPAYAVDKVGNRLGRGAGYYDRTLRGVTADLVAVVNDEEVVTSLPADPHDVRVGWVLTPDAGFRRLG